MTVTAAWAEFNGASAYATPDVADITNTNWGSADSANLVAASNPITAGTNSYEKKHAVKFTITASETADTFYFGATAGLTGAGDITGNNDTYVFKDVGDKTTLTAPSQTTMTGSSNVPASIAAVPATNIAGGPADATGEGSNFFLHQIQVHALSTAGTSITVGFRYVVTA